MKTLSGKISFNSLALSYAGITDRGMVRSLNEDAMLVYDERLFFCVADGMGGHEAGEVASAMTVDAMNQFIKARSEPGESTEPIDLEDILLEEHDLERAVKFANKRVFEAQKGRKMGCTVVAALFEEKAEDSTVVLGDKKFNAPVSIVNVGDSRAYLWHEETLSQITNDHSLVFELYRNGRITKDEIRSHPRKNVITRAVGSSDEVEPELYHTVLKQGDILLLCSDGLTSMVDDTEIASELRPDQSPEEIAENLVTAANRAGGRDNITVIVVKAS